MIASLHQLLEQGLYLFSKGYLHKQVKKVAKYPLSGVGVDGMNDTEGNNKPLSTLPRVLYYFASPPLQVKRAHEVIPASERLSMTATVIRRRGARQRHIRHD
jgi:hypothetical protein